MIRTILNADIADIACAARALENFHGYINAKGYSATRRQVFVALLNVRPWLTATQGHHAPWRRVRDQIA